MELSKQIDLNFTKAFKEKDQIALDTLRMLKAAMLNFRIEKGVKSLEDEDIIKIIKSEIKKRQDSIESYIQGKREDLADKEKKEMDLLKKYLPEQLSESETRKIINEIILKRESAGKKDFGAIMGELSKTYSGRIDNKLASNILKELLK